MANEENKQNESESMFSPRFKSMAAMAGWDEETLLSACLIVDDTPDRHLTLKKRTVFPIQTPPTTNSRKKRRVQRSPVPIVALDLNDDSVESTKNETPKDVKDEKKETEVACSTTSLPCMDKLREELSCAICLDICFEPSTTPCGHSFCLKCLRSSASKCGKKCPKCRQLISNGRSCTVNTVLWNTIQLLFPQEVEAKKSTVASNSREKISETAFYDNLRNESPRGSEMTIPTRTRRSRQSRNEEGEEDPLASLIQEIRRNIRASSSSSSLRASIRATTPSQNEDAAFALRLQREEFMGAVRGTTTRTTNTTRLNQSRADSSVSLARETTLDQSSTVSSSNGTSDTRRNSSFTSARANLREIASRAANRVRGWNS